MANAIQTVLKLHKAPFGPDVADDDLWLDDANTEAVRRLLEAVTKKEHVLITAESGAGKTSALRAMRAQLSAAHYRVVYLAMVTLGPRDFMRQLCRALGVQAKATAAAAFHAIQAQVTQLHGDHRIHPVLVLDEVHLMPERTLQHLHILTNFDFDSKPLLSLVLVGLPEFHDRLRMGLHRSLLTRLSTAIEIRPGDPSRTAAYVRHRLAAAGAQSELFTPDALTVLHELSGGLPRCIDVIASGALGMAVRKDVALVDRHLVTAAYRATPLA